MQTVDVSPVTVEGAISIKEKSSPTPLAQWIDAFKQIMPVYCATHLAALMISCLSVLLLYSKPYHLIGKGYQQIPTPPLSTIWKSWAIWPHDTPWYIQIAQEGYTKLQLTAYFPMYPFLIRVTTFLLGGQHALIAALLVSNLAGITMLMVFYRLVKNDFGHELALRSVLYLSIFPSAFFFIAGYTETIFLTFLFLSFYAMRKGNWWLAGLFGFLATLTRNTGIFMLIPLGYDYLRQQQFRFKLRFDVLGIALVPAALGLYMLYCFIRFQDPLAFQHAQESWHHVLLPPWEGLSWPIHAMMKAKGLLSFVIQRNSIELGSTLFILILLVLCLVGPWRLPRQFLPYLLFAFIVWIIPLCSPIKPVDGPLAFQSLTRYMLEVFPAFILLAALGQKYRMVNYIYLAGSFTLFIFLLIQFLLGYIVI